MRYWTFSTLIGSRNVGPSIVDSHNIVTGPVIVCTASIFRPVNLPRKLGANEPHIVVSKVDT